MKLVIYPKPPCSKYHFLLDFDGELLTIHEDPLYDWCSTDSVNLAKQIKSDLAKGKKVVLSVTLLDGVDCSVPANE